MVSSVGENQNYKYYCNEGVITKADLKTRTFMTRNLQTGSWHSTQDLNLINKMITGKGTLASQSAADLLFAMLKKT